LPDNWLVHQVIGKRQQRLGRTVGLKHEDERPIPSPNGPHDGIMYSVGVFNPTERNRQLLLGGGEECTVTGTSVISAGRGTFPRRGVPGAEGDDQFRGKVLHDRFPALRFSIS
jgi:hypothetical protein